MPLPKGTRYRYRTLLSGEKQRLAFKGENVIEVRGTKRRGRKVRGYTKRIG